MIHPGFGDSPEEEQRNGVQGGISVLKAVDLYSRSSDLKAGLIEMICAKRLNPQWIYMGTVHLYCSRYYGTL